MRSLDELNEAIAWVAEQAEQCSARYLLLVGNKAFALHREVAQACANNRRLEIIHPAALAYASEAPGSILALADEVEYGRTLYEECAPTSRWPDASLHLCALYLSQSASSTESRKASIEYLGHGGSYDRRFAHALQHIQAWRSFADDREFHRCGIVSYTSFLRERLRAPINADATLFRVDFRDVPVDQVVEALSRLGHFANRRHSAATFFPEPCMMQTPPPLRGRASDAYVPRVLFKVFAESNTSILVSPMVFQPLTIAKPWDELSPAVRWVGQGIRTARDLQRCTDSACEALSYYNLLFFVSNVEAMYGFLDVLKTWLGSDCLAHVEMDSQRLNAFFGVRLGQGLARAVAERLPTAGVPTDNPQLPAPTWEHEPLVDIAKLMLVKEGCHDAFRRHNPSCEDPILAQRWGLTFEEMRRITGIDSRTLAASVDLLCDLEWTVPFNRCVRLPNGGWQVARCYNTTHGEILGFLTKIIRLADGYGVPTNITTLNKAAAFVTHTALAPHVGETRGNLKENDVRVRPYFFGKQVSFYIDQVDQEFFLDRYLTLDSTKKVLVKEGDQYKLKRNVDTHAVERHFSLCDAFQMEAYLGLFLQIHQRIREATQEGPRLDIPGDIRAVEALAVLVDLMGSYYPEGALGTISVNLHRSSPDVTGFPSAKKQELLTSMARKVRILDGFAPGYAQVRRWLHSNPQTVAVEEALRRFLYYPKGSNILRFLQSVVDRSIASFPKPTHRLQQYWKVLGDLSGGGRPLPPLPADEEHDLWIVCADMRNSKQVITRPLGTHWKEYVQNIILTAWARFYNGYLIDVPGDGVIVAFEKEDEALAYAACAAIHSNEICSVCLPDSGYGVGVSHGRVARTAQQSVSVAPSSPFDPIALAAIAAKGHKGLRVCAAPGTETDLDPVAAFQERVIGPVGRA